MSFENGTLRVGPRLRHARLSKGLRMRDLAQAAGCGGGGIGGRPATRATGHVADVPKSARMTRADLGTARAFDLYVADSARALENFAGLARDKCHYQETKR